MVDDYPVVSLMVFQVVVILAVGKGDVALFGDQELLDAVFIDHIAAVVRCYGGAACLMNGAELRAVRSIGVRDGAAVAESYRAWANLENYVIERRN